jgi:hypothetical protein
LHETKKPKKWGKESQDIYHQKKYRFEITALYKTTVTKEGLISITFATDI